MKRKHSLLVDILEVVISVAIISFILIKFIVLPCQVHGLSMFPTLKDKARGYSFVITKNIGINRFDICVVDVKSESEKLLVKRVIGLPNETVEYRDNKLFIDGEYIEENFLDGVTTNDLTIKLGDDEYFCLGDNRDISKDSRYYGPFKEDKILATKILIIYPFDEFGVKK